MQKPSAGELAFFFGLFSIVTVLAASVMWSYITPLFLAGVCAVLFEPVERRIRKLVGGRRGVAAGGTVAVILLVIIIPVVILAGSAISEVSATYRDLANGGGVVQVLGTVADRIDTILSPYIPGFNARTDMYRYVQASLVWAAGNLNVFLTGIFTFLFDTILMLAAVFFYYRDAERIRAFFLRWSPLSDRYDVAIIDRVGRAVSSVVKGSLLGAVTQGVFVGIGFAMFGVGNPVLWGMLSSIAALIPMVGTALTTVPAVVFLYLSGAPMAALGLAVWAAFFVGLSDNFLSPFVMQRGMQVHPFLILLSVFGGLALFGPVGFLVGPVTLAFFFTLLDLSPDIVRGTHLEKETDPKEHA